MKKLPLILSLLLLLAACQDAANNPSQPTPVPETVNEETAVTASPASSSADVTISEVLLGAPGNNNREFIELYNPRETAVDLQGWSLWYRSRADQEPEAVLRWTTPSEIPPLGHLLLARTGEDFGLIADAYFDVPLSNRRGGLILRDGGGNDVATLGWGEDAPPDYFAGTPAAPPTDGASLERLPGGDAGNGQDTGSNAADFAANAAPTPQNSGSPMTPAAGRRLVLHLDVPETVEPGAAFAYTVRVENPGETAVANVTVTIPIPDYFTILTLPNGTQEDGGIVQWVVGELAPGSAASADLQLQSPLTYVDTIVRGYYAEGDGVVRSYGPVQQLGMAGGALPIATARELIGSVVGVEGVATMYTGGYFAGSTGTKFYLEDDSGGIQVYVPGGMGLVQVNIGDQVRVTGKIELYRDSIELIPTNIPEDVTVLGTTNTPAPLPIAIADNENDDTVVGRLTTLEGTAVRVEEFSFSYEVDLADELGNSTLVYIEKDTGIVAEGIEVGAQYRITGITEFYSARRQIKPRVQDDIAPVYPPIVWVEQQTQNNVAPGGVLTYTITAFNYTPDTLVNVMILAPLPEETGEAWPLPTPEGVAVDAGVAGEMFWFIDSLPGNGGQVQVQYGMQVLETAVETITAPPVTLSADGLETAVTATAYTSFLGDGVPVWAIQGSNDRSPYTGQEVTTVGAVTAVFPELGGFWLQTAEPDGDPATSDAVFVLSTDLADLNGVTNLVQVSGRVRELSGQTTLEAQEVVILPGTEAAVIEAAIYDPPADAVEALLYNESLEGMLVWVAEPAVAIAPTTQYGEFALVYEKWGVDTVPRTELPTVGYLIFVDDGSSNTHANQSTLPYAVAKGDVVVDVVGPLAYTFGNYKIEPLNRPRVTPVGGERPLPALPEANANQITIATFNVENLFDTSFPHPDSPPRPSAAEYALKLNKVADAIVHMGAPTILGLQEVENVGVLETLAALDALAPYRYQAILVEGEDSRGIDVGYLVRSDRVTVEGFANYPEPSGLTARPPLMMTVTVSVAGDEERLYVLNNHFLALSAGEEATEPTRTAQAAWNVTLMARIWQQDPTAQFVVLGDLNSFYQTPPLDTLQGAGLRHVYEFVPRQARPYTYIFEGGAQTLDHILLSSDLYARVTAVTTLPINADFPLPPPDDATARRVSDHDPLIVTLTYE